MSNIVTYEQEENIAKITIDDGKANAVSPQFVGELNRALDQAEMNKTVVILTGRPGKFSAGFDLSVGVGAPAGWSKPPPNYSVLWLFRHWSGPPDGQFRSS